MKKIDGAKSDNIVFLGINLSHCTLKNGFGSSDTDQFRLIFQKLRRKFYQSWCTNSAYRQDRQYICTLVGLPVEAGGELFFKNIDDLGLTDGVI